MNTDQRMVAWSAVWALIDGVVICASCARTQPCSQSDEHFAHEQACRAHGVPSSTPWVELHDILDAARG